MNPDLRVFLLITKISINPNFRFQGMLKFKSKTSCWFGEKDKLLVIQPHSPRRGNKMASITFKGSEVGFW